MDSIIQYFNGERMQCIIGILISVVLIAASIYFLYLKKPIFLGMAYAFLPLSVFLIGICITVVARSQGDIDRVTSYHQIEKEKLRSIELPRMEKVMRNFSMIKKVEMGLFVIGLILMFFFRDDPLMKGIAIGLMTEGLILLAFDFMAEQRGQVYIDFLRSI